MSKLSASHEDASKDSTAGMGELSKHGLIFNFSRDGSFSFRTKLKFETPCLCKQNVTE